MQAPTGMVTEYSFITLLTQLLSDFKLGCEATEIQNLVFKISKAFRVPRAADKEGEMEAVNENAGAREGSRMEFIDWRQFMLAIINRHACEVVASEGGKWEFFIHSIGLHCYLSFH